MGTSATRTRAFARVVVACALLGGLFLMHGLATLDCHAAASAPGVTASLMPGMPMPGLSVPAAAGMSHLSSTGDTDTSGIGAAAGVCVSIPPTSGMAGLMVLLLLAAGAFLLGAVPRPSSTTRPGCSRRRRAPPPVAGSALLLILCISRT